MKVDGGCLRGHVTYEAEVDPETIPKLDRQPTAAELSPPGDG